MLNKNRQNIILYGLVLSVAFGGIWVWMLKKNDQHFEAVPIIKPDSSKADSESENAEIVIKDLILKEIEKHKGLEVIVNAREGKILNSTDKIECKNINCALNDNNEQIADLKSDSALIHKITKNVHLSGPTSGHFYDVRIDGLDISYNYSSQTLITENKISYKHKCFSMVAKKSLVDLKNSKITMSGGVECTILNSSARYNHVN